jgi:hypothetical protein
MRTSQPSSSVSSARASISRIAPARSAHAPTLRQAKFSDYAGIKNLELRFDVQAKPQEEFERLWLDNPSYRSQRETWPIGWVLETANREIVGTFSNIPLQYYLNRRLLRVATSRAWISDEAYRPYALLLLNEFYSQRRIDLFLCTSVSPASIPTVSAFQSQKVPAGAWDRAGFWITHYPSFAASALLLKQIPCAPLFQYPCALALWAKDHFAPHSFHGIRTSETAVCSAFNSQFDDFWEETQKLRSGILLADRSSAWLAWHFKDGISSGRAFAITLSKGQALYAYGIFHRKDEPKIGMRRLRLVDYQSLDGDPSLVKPILARAAQICREKKIDALEIVGWRLEPGDVIDQLAPHKRDLPCWRYWYKTNDAVLAERLSHPASWDPSTLDGDSSLDSRTL